MSEITSLTQTMQCPSSLDATRALLGNDVVLLPVPTKEKRPAVKGWPEITVERMSDPEYLAMFNGNIGVLLGEKSGHLCSVDVDSDDDFTVFLELNPRFQETLQTKGSRGGNFWFRVAGAYPDLTTVKCADGCAWGEFRSTGGQTIIHGTHPLGMPYQRLVDRRPIDIVFDSIVWPDDLVLPWLKSDYELLVEKKGEPFQYGRNDKLTLNEPAIVEKFVLERRTLHEVDQGSFYQYDDGTGLWLTRNDDEIKDQFIDSLKVAADDLGDDRILGMRTTQRLSSLTTILKGRVGRRGVFAGKRPLIHCQNGVLILSEKTPALWTFHPDYHSRNASPIAYDAAARCPRFLNELLYSALPEEDISLIQRVGGAMLMGRNSAQRFLLLMGTAGGGKSTLVNIIEKIVGPQNVTQLRTEFLAERFESFSYLGKTLLSGKDVTSDFLQQKGAQKLKALVGGDNLQCEKKGGAQFQYKGDFNVIITCNSGLRVRLDGDHGAWHRRILAIKYDRPKAERRIDRFDERLIEEEGSGILNFFIEGAIQHLEELATNGDYRLSGNQQLRINAILRESDSVRQFVEACVVTYTGSDVTDNELYAAYLGHCSRNGWHTYPKHEVTRILPDLLLELRHCRSRNDICRNDRGQRGYCGVAIQTEGQ
jgi:P4 family phage/plasmid primase-like protien